MPDVVIRCDASPRIGFGHLTRCIALAEAFRDDCGVDATLLMRQDDAALATANRAGVRVAIIPQSAPASDLAIIEALKGARALVLDYRDDLSGRVIDAAKGNGTALVTIDDPTSRRLAADLAFYPPIPQIKEWDWTGFAGELLSGWDWVVLRRDLGSPAARDRALTAVPRVLISLGGSDPNDMSSLVLDALSRVETPCDPTLVIGPANSFRDRLRARASAQRVRFVDAPSDFAALARGADLAVISFGVTAYELAALRVPALYLCLTSDHARSASIFEAADAGRVVGTHPTIGADAVAVALDRALRESSGQGAWQRHMPILLDGGGSTRVARRIASHVRGFHASRGS